MIPVSPAQLPAALRACASGIHPLEAGTSLLIDHGSWLCRQDFTSRFITTGTSISDGITMLATTDWEAAITALNDGELPSSGGEQRMLLLAASLASGIPVDLRDALTGLDHRNIDRLVNAVFHASGRRQQHDRP